jgi:hypothetical protein
MQETLSSNPGTEKREKVKEREREREGKRERDDWSGWGDHSGPIVSVSSGSATPYTHHSAFVSLSTLGPSWETLAVQWPPL